MKICRIYQHMKLKRQNHNFQTLLMPQGVQPSNLSGYITPYWQHFKIYRQGEDHMCGGCRKHYRSGEEANACLSQCIWSFVRGVPIEVFLTHKSVQFRCPFCYRVHKDEESVERCFQKCMVRMCNQINFQIPEIFDYLFHPSPQTGFEPEKYEPIPLHKSKGGLQEMLEKIGSLEQDVNKLKGIEPPENAKNNTDETMQSADVESIPEEPDEVMDVSLASRKKEAEKLPAISAAEAIVASEPSFEPENTIVPSAEEESPGQIAKRKNRVPFEKKFIRQGAKYECATCHQKYFTKDDVETCFDGHPENA